MQKNVEQYLAFKRGDVKMPAHLQPKREERAVMYTSKIVEFLTRTPIYVPQLMHSSIIIGFLWYAFTQTGLNTLLVCGVYFGAIFSWTFVEYAMHRFFYHTESESKVWFKLQYNGHGVHHHHPKDPGRLALPPVPALILATLFFGLFYLIMSGYAVAFFPGFLTGYVLYITMHYAQHRFKAPNYKPWKRLWSYHVIHHYKNPYCCFGVSTIFWDLIFRTTPTEEDKKGLV